MLGQTSGMSFPHNKGKCSANSWSFVSQMRYLLVGMASQICTTNISRQRRINMVQSIRHQQQFRVHMDRYCGRLVGPHVLPQFCTSHVYWDFLLNNVPQLLENECLCVMGLWHIIAKFCKMYWIIPNTTNMYVEQEQSCVAPMFAQFQSSRFLCVETLIHIQI